MSSSTSKTNTTNITQLTPEIDRKCYQEMHQMLSNTFTSKQPLRGQEVMVPMTSKAFLRGVLSPKKTDDGEDVILMNLDIRSAGNADNLVEKPMSDALLFLEQRIGPHHHTKKVAGDASCSTTANNSDATAPQSKSKFKPTAQPHIAALPSVDIREEYDAKGNRMLGEAVNVQARLEAFRQTLQQGGAGMTTEPAVTQSLAGKQGGIINTAPKDVISRSSEAMEIKEEEKVVEKKQLDYDALSKRLDELIILEEKAVEVEANETKKKKGFKGKRSSGGWNRGFLNGGGDDSSPKSKSSQSKSKSKGAKKTLQSSQSASTKAMTAVEMQKPAPARRTASAPAISTRNKVQVRIRESLNETKEIPRIGSQSVNALKQKPQHFPPPEPAPRSSVGLVSRNSNLGRSASRQQKVNGDSSSLFSSSRPVHEFGADVFGGVKEKEVTSTPSVVRKNDSKRAQQSYDSSDAAIAAARTAPKKKLSKFAQQRLEMKQREMQK